MVPGNFVAVHATKRTHTHIIIGTVTFTGEATLLKLIYIPSKKKSTIYTERIRSPVG